jgi:hypothetical protein
MNPTYFQIILEAQEVKALKVLLFPRKEEAKRERCKFLIDKDDAGGRQWQECSYHLDMAEYGNCHNCSLYAVEDCENKEQKVKP